MWNHLPLDALTNPWRSEADRVVDRYMLSQQDWLRAELAQRGPDVSPTA